MRLLYLNNGKFSVINPQFMPVCRRCIASSAANQIAPWLGTPRPPRLTLPPLIIARQAPTHSAPRRENRGKFYLTLKIIPVELIKGL